MGYKNKINDIKRAKLYDYNIPERWYSLDDGLKPDCMILYKNYSKWEYFYMDEKGNRRDFRIFYDEELAYDHLWEEIKTNLTFFKIKPRKTKE